MSILFISETTGGAGVDISAVPFRAYLVGGTRKAVLIGYFGGGTHWVPRARIASMKYVEATRPWPTFCFQFRW